MLNILFAIDDELKINRLASVFKNDRGLNYLFFSDSSKAMEYVTHNSVDIAVICADMSILDGNELAEAIIDKNLKCNFIFTFREHNLNKALEIFNTYDNCQLIDFSVCEPESLKFMIDNVLNDVNEVVGYKKEFEDFKSLEKNYKQKFLEMSDVLNTRIGCYTNIIKMYSETSRYFFEDASRDNSNKFLDFIDNELSEYINFFLERKIDFDSFYEVLIKKYHVPECKKLFLLNRCDVSEYEVHSKLVFILKFLCDFFLKFLNSNKGKVNISDVGNSYRMDIIYEINSGLGDTDSFSYSINIINKIADSFSDKIEYATRDGIFQYRLLFKK